MAIEVLPLPIPPTVDAQKLKDFGREVKGVNPGELDWDSKEFQEIHDLLYKVYEIFSCERTSSLSSWSARCVALPRCRCHSRAAIRLDEGAITREFAFAACPDTPQAFDRRAESYGHGNNKTGSEKKSILHPDLKTIPRVPQVQLIGNGTVYNHEGLAEAKLKHPSHTTFHKTRVSPEDEAKGYTRFYRWHIDAALYDLSPPKVTTLYGVTVPQGPHQTVRYDDGTGDELEVPLGTTAFVDGKNMFDILPPELKSVAVRTRVRYAPHPYVWMAPAHALPTGLGIMAEGLEMSYDELPPWEESKVKVLPMVCILRASETTELTAHLAHSCGGTL